MAAHWCRGWREDWGRSISGGSETIFGGGGGVESRSSNYGGPWNSGREVCAEVQRSWTRGAVPSARAGPAIHFSSFAAGDEFVVAEIWRPSSAEVDSGNLRQSQPQQRNQSSGTQAVRSQMPPNHPSHQIRSNWRGTFRICRNNKLMGTIRTIVKLS